MFLIATIFVNDHLEQDHARNYQLARYQCSRKTNLFREVVNVRARIFELKSKQLTNTDIISHHS